MKLSDDGRCQPNMLSNFQISVLRIEILAYDTSWPSKSQPTRESNSLILHLGTKKRFEMLSVEVFETFMTLTTAIMNVEWSFVRGGLNVCMDTSMRCFRCHGDEGFFKSVI
jgi:hypothetical protein